MTDIAAWLNELGLGRYASLFEEHEIDGAALPLLTDDMLVEIGLPVGPRAKVLAAISDLPQPAASNAAHPDHAAPHTSDGDQAERRQITVMFCDLVNSTALAERLDPEDLLDLMRRYQTACGAVIERHGGHIAQYLGDGIMAYFGWPQASEDAAERAVQAGLDVVDAVSQIQNVGPLEVRIGISTGVVVIGDSGRGDPSTPAGAVGETPYIASRLQGLAEPNTVLVAQATKRLVEGRFDVEDLGSRTLKGIVDPFRVFRVLGVKALSTRFAARPETQMAPLVGRDMELALLQQRWRDARDGEGQVVFVSGVPGIGKSRITHELETWIGQDAYFPLRFQCSPHHTESALFPVIEQFERIGGWYGDGEGASKTEKLAKLLARFTDRVDAAMPLIAELLSIPTDEAHALPDLSPKQLKDQTLSVLADLVLDASTRLPVFCLIEDIQWIDPSTEELLDLLAGQTEKARILLVMTHRPEYRVRPTTAPNVSAITISRLRRAHVAALAQAVIGEDAVPGTVLDRIVEESDAVPLYVEELARGAVEAGAADDHATGGPYAQPGASWSVPATLRDSLMARLDLAPQGRSVAQTAAVVGREFSYDMLRQVSDLSSTELDATLASLEEHEIVKQIDRRSPARYAFKHALLRDSAYESMLKTNRREIHAKVAAVIEKDAPDVVASRPELLAYHYSQAGESEFAVRYWLVGGKRAQSRSANLEAIAQFEKALEFLAFLPETSDRKRTELEIQLALGLCFIAVRGYAADETRFAFERACALTEQLEDTSHEIQATFGLWGHYWMRARHDRALELGQALLAKAEQHDDLVPHIVGHRALGSTLFTRGDFVLARDHLEKSIAMSRQDTVGGLSSSFAVDPRIAAQLMLAWDFWILGYPDQAYTHVMRALEEAKAHAQPYSVAFAHYVTSAVHLLRGEPTDSIRHAEHSLALSREHGINLYALYSQFGRGCALAELGQLDEAIKEITEGIEEARKSKLGYMRGFMLGWLATLQAKSGDPTSALSTIDDALQNTDDDSGRAWEAELERLRGDFLLAAPSPKPDDAVRCYLKANEIARDQSARSLELRATTSLARLWESNGRVSDAFEALSPVFAWFTEGLDTADLRDADALLRHIRPGT